MRKKGEGLTAACKTSARISIMRTIIGCIVIAVVLLAAAAFIIPGSCDVFDAKRDSAGHAFYTRFTSDDEKVRLAEKELQESMDNIRSGMVSLLISRNRTKEIESEKRRLEGEKKAEESIIYKARTVLEGHGPGDTVKIGDNEYPYETVKADAGNHVEKAFSLRGEIQRKAETIKQAHANEQKTSDLLEKAKSQVQMDLASLEDLKRRLQEARLRKEMQDQMHNIMDSFDLSNSRHYMTELQDTVERLDAEVQVDSQFQGSPSYGSVDWDNGGSHDVIDRIDEYFSDSGTDDSPAKPSVTDALGALDTEQGE